MIQRRRKFFLQIISLVVLTVSALKVSYHDENMNDKNITLVTLAEIVAPPGARIYTLRLKVKLDRAWQEAVTAAGPDTNSYYFVSEVGDIYPPTGTEEIEADYVLLNYSFSNGWYAAKAWSEENGLSDTVPREAFSVGEQYPILHNTLGFNPMFVVATTKHYFWSLERVCYVWWDGSKRGANTLPIINLDTPFCWFLFRKPVIKTSTI